MLKKQVTPSHIVVSVQAKCITATIVLCIDADWMNKAIVKKRLHPDEPLQQTNKSTRVKKKKEKEAKPSHGCYNDNIRHI